MTDDHTVTMIVQLNGKYVTDITISSTAGKDAIANAALKATKHSFRQAKTVIVPGKLVNVIPVRLETPEFLIKQ